MWDPRFLDGRDVWARSADAKYLVAFLPDSTKLIEQEVSQRKVDCGDMGYSKRPRSAVSTPHDRPLSPQGGKYHMPRPTAIAPATFWCADPTPFTMLGVQAMLLAAGHGTRLRPLTERLPKPVVPVANRPLAGFALEHLANSGVSSVVANTHPMPEIVEGLLSEACPPSVALRFSRETNLLGTGGGVANAWPLFSWPGESVIVLNGDTLYAPDLSRALRLHRESGAVATMILRPADEPERYGTVGVDAHGWVRSLLRVPETPGLRWLMYTGVQILSPRARQALPASGCIIRNAYRGWVDSGTPVLGVVDESPWADLGTIAEYHRVNLELASGHWRWPDLRADRGSIVSESAFVARDAAIEDSIVGPRARVSAGTSVTRGVVWPDTEITRSVRDAVVTPAGVVPAY